MRRLTIPSLPITIIICSLVMLGCSEEFYGSTDQNLPPNVILSSGPVEGDTTGYRVHFYWTGWDDDGEVAGYEIAIADGDPIGFNDTHYVDVGLINENIFIVTANENPDSLYTNNNYYTRYDMAHTFFVRAYDLEGAKSKPDYRSFTAWTLAPIANITRPVLGGQISTPRYSSIVTFGWDATDPIDMPGNSQDPDSIRYMYTKLVDHEGNEDSGFDILGDMNRSPERYEDKWSDWIAYNAPNDSGRVVIIPTIGKESLELNKKYVFAVQAMDEAGAVTSIFVDGQNARLFWVSTQAGPSLVVTEPHLGSFYFLGDALNIKERELPPEVPLRFSWTADASRYGGEIMSYRYGWDIQNLDDPSEWDVSPNPEIRRTETSKILLLGKHIFYVEAVDNAGTVTLGRISIDIVPFTMERDLLWVYNCNYGTYADWGESYAYQQPIEELYMEFWTDLCSRADGFIPERDIYRAPDDNRLPEIRDISVYKNIIWTYQRATWSELVRFIPESLIEAGVENTTLNYLPLFLAKGGHLWTLGDPDYSGAMASVFYSSPELPASFYYEIDKDHEGDTSGVNSMAYLGYCITVMDKVRAASRKSDPTPIRRVDRDALRFAYLDYGDTLTAKYPDLPDTLYLWEEVTQPGKFFYPVTRGFLYVEIYDPIDWMEVERVQSQSCFHPIYRMRARNSSSQLDHQTVAIWVSKYGHVVPDIPGGVAANSFHFGFPLWYFNRDSAAEIADVVFREWQILAAP